MGFSIGRQSLEDLLVTERNLYDSSIVENDMAFRFRQANLKVLALSGRLLDQKPLEWSQSSNRQ